MAAGHGRAGALWFRSGQAHIALRSRRGSSLRIRILWSGMPSRTITPVNSSRTVSASTAGRSSASGSPLSTPPSLARPFSVIVRNGVAAPTAAWSSAEPTLDPNSETPDWPPRGGRRQLITASAPSSRQRRAAAEPMPVPAAAVITTTWPSSRHATASTSSTEPPMCTSLSSRPEYIHDRGQPHRGSCYFLNIPIRLSMLKPCWGTAPPGVALSTASGRAWAT